MFAPKGNQGALLTIPLQVVTLTLRRLTSQHSPAPTKTERNEQLSIPDLNLSPKNA